MIDIFFSADIADSTKYKQNSQDAAEDQSWIRAFEAYFREMPLVLMGQIGLRHEDFWGITRTRHLEGFGLGGRDPTRWLAQENAEVILSSTVGKHHLGYPRAKTTRFKK